MTDEQSIRDQLIKAMYNAPTTGNVVVRYSDAADAILASPVIRRIQAEAIRTWADFQDAAIRNIAYAADDEDRAEVNRWTVSARVYADRIERGETA